MKFARYFIRTGLAVIIIMVIAIGVLCYQDGLNPLDAIFPGKLSTESFHVLPNEIEKIDGLERFDRVVVDGNSETVQKLYQRVSDEAKKLPDVFIDIFNKSGFKLVISDNVYKYTRKHVPDGFYLGGVTQEHGSDKRVVLFPVQGDRTSLYHELGHVLISVYEMEKETLPVIWEHDYKGTVALTGKYAASGADECWAEAFRFMLQNMDNPTAMAKAEALMPVSYLCFQRFIEYGEEQEAA